MDEADFYASLLTLWTTLSEDDEVEVEPIEIVVSNIQLEIEDE